MFPRFIMELLLHLSFQKLDDMIENNRIIIVDDNEADLNQLRQVFYEHGIGCRGFVYEGFNLPRQPLKGVRFAFFDMNLNPAGNINSTLKDAISHYIDPENGPYVLVFWSSHVEDISDFKSFVNRTDDEFKQKLKPILLTSIDKAEFLDGKKSLSEKVDSILSSDLVKCIVKFDESVILSARETLDRILKIIPFTDEWGESARYNEKCQIVFSKMAEAIYGWSNAKECPDAAIKESVIPIFKHILLHRDDTYWKEYLSPLYGAKKGSLSFPGDFSVEKLNTILHTDDHEIQKQTRCTRGAVCMFGDNDFENVFQDLFGIGYNDWFSRTFPQMEKYKEDSKLIAIEFSAACDFSQNKKRTNKYLLGVLCPSCLAKELNDKPKGKGDYTFLFPFCFEFKGKSMTIGVNLNYTFTLSASGATVLMPPSFILTKETMDMLGHKYASHVSRIGITSF